MPPPVPSVVLCRPSDVFDYLGTDGTQLRLDDHNLATAQTITVTADALVGDGSIAVMPLTSPLLPGSTLEFDGAAMPAVVEVSLTALAQVGDTSLTVTALTAQVNNLAAATDNGVNTALAARLVKACYYATDQVQQYTAPRYDATNLSQSWSVNRWATVLAAYWIAKRLCRPCPQSIESDYERTMEELEKVLNGQMQIPRISPLTSGWPFVTNTTIDISYTYDKIRVEPQLSEGTPTQYGQYIDWNSAFLFEW